MYSYGPPHMAEQKQDDQREHTYNSSVRIRDVALKTCQKRWTIGRSGERGSGISVLATRHDDDDDVNQSRRKKTLNSNKTWRKMGSTLLFWLKTRWIISTYITKPSYRRNLLKRDHTHTNGPIEYEKYWNRCIWFLSLSVFGLLSSSLFPQRFRRYVLRPFSCVCRTREPTRNFELRPWLNP